MIAVVKWTDSDHSVEDILEHTLVGRSNPDSSAILHRWLKISQEVWIGMYDDKVLCMYGLATPSAISNRGYLWLLTTDALEEHKFLFVRHSQLVIENALKTYELIVGHVQVGNAPARKWLRWLGAEIESPIDQYSTFRIRRK